MPLVSCVRESRRQIGRSPEALHLPGIPANETLPGIPANETLPGGERVAPAGPAYTEAEAVYGSDQAPTGAVRPGDPAPLPVTGPMARPLSIAASMTSRRGPRAPLARPLPS